MVNTNSDKDAFYQLAAISGLRNINLIDILQGKLESFVRQMNGNMLGQYNGKDIEIYQKLVQNHCKENRKVIEYCMEGGEEKKLDFLNKRDPSKQ